MGTSTSFSCCSTCFTLDRLLCLSVCLFDCLTSTSFSWWSTCFTLDRLLCLSVCLSVFLSVCRSARLSVCRSVCLSVRTSSWIDCRSQSCVMMHGYRHATFAHTHWVKLFQTLSNLDNFVRFKTDSVSQNSLEELCPFPLKHVHFNRQESGRQGICTCHHCACSEHKEENSSGSFAQRGGGVLACVCHMHTPLIIKNICFQDKGFSSRKAQCACT